MDKVRLNKTRCKQGLDGLNFEYVLNLDNMKHFYAPPEYLTNEVGRTIVKMECIGGKVKAFVNVVHSIRADNVKPFSLVDAIKMELAREQVLGFMRAYLQKYLQKNYSETFIRNMKVTALECNITLPTLGGATPSDVIALFDLALDKTMVFRKRTNQLGYGKKNTGCAYSRPKEYRLKIYDKTEEQQQKGNTVVPGNLLRIEVVFINRSLRRMYGKKRTLIDLLSVQAMDTMCREYKRVLEEEIINQSIKPCLNYCVEQLVESLMNSDAGKEISETVIRYRDLIPDIEVLRKALKRWYRLRESEDHSKQAIRYCRMKSSGIAEGVLKTLRAFHNAAG